MFIHCKQCIVKAHLLNGRYVIEVTVPARKRRAIKNYIGGTILGWITVNEPERKIAALTARNFHFARFYTLHEHREIDETTGKIKVQWFIGPCRSRN